MQLKKQITLHWLAVMVVHHVIQVCCTLGHIHLVTSIIKSIYHKWSISKALHLKISHVKINYCLWQQNIFSFLYQNLNDPSDTKVVAKEGVFGVLHDERCHLKMVGSGKESKINVLTLLQTIGVLMACLSINNI